MPKIASKVESSRVDWPIFTQELDEFQCIDAVNVDQMLQSTNSRHRFGVESYHLVSKDSNLGPLGIGLKRLVFTD